MRELEGVELVVAVAERIMGWTPHTNYGDNEPDYPCYNAGTGGMVVWRGWNHRAEDWSPLRSMSDAWEVSDRLHTLGYQLDLGNFRPGGAPESHNWHAKFANGKCTASMGYGMTAGEAICRAALNAVQEGETE